MDGADCWWLDAGDGAGGGGLDMQKPAVWRAFGSGVQGGHEAAVADAQFLVSLKGLNQICPIQGLLRQGQPFVEIAIVTLAILGGKQQGRYVAVFALQALRLAESRCFKSGGRTALHEWLRWFLWGVFRLDI